MGAGEGVGLGNQVTLARRMRGESKSLGWEQVTKGRLKKGLWGHQDLGSRWQRNHLHRKPEDDPGELPALLTATSSHKELEAAES